MMMPNIQYRVQVKIVFQLDYLCWIDNNLEMKALILVGGYGTRLRPLTINFPKSAFPFVNKPLVEHQIAALAAVGVVEVVIAINYQADHIKKTLEPLELKYNIKITYSQQTEAMGTAGPLKLAEKILKADNPEGLFFTFNADIICDFPLKQLLEIHRKHGKQGTMVLAQAEDPRRFGVLSLAKNGKIVSYVEKPQHPTSNTINAGMYLLNVSILDRIPLKHCMLEQDIFPKMVEEGQLYGLPLRNKFWYDTGKPEDYLAAQQAFLNYHNPNSNAVLIDPSTVVEHDCKIGPNVVIGPNCHIRTGSRIKNCTILQGSTIGYGCFLSDCVISWRCKIGSWVRIEGLTCLAEEVTLKDESRLTECMVLSHKNVGGIFSKNVLL